MQQATPPSEPVGIRSPKACVLCATAKVKCETDPGQIICKRCRRLKKTCHPQPPSVQKRRAKPKSDVVRLEQKLDSVTAAILAASKPASPGQQSVSQTPQSPVAYLDQFITSENEATLMLDVYRNELTQHFPFIALSPWTTFAELRNKKPFLLLTVMMIACRHDIPRQGLMAMTIREIISCSILMKGEKSLDLLQGMLLYLAWHQLHVHLGSQLTNLIHLIMSMTIDLGLNKPAGLRRHSKAQREYFRMDGRENIIAPKSLEERRTFLGCYYLLTMILMTARDFEPIRYTKYAEECCQLISEAAEYPTDLYLVQLVKLAHMSEKINRTITSQDWNSFSNIIAPVGAMVRSLEPELHSLKPSSLSDSLHSVLLMVHYHTIETYLYEISLDESVGASSYGSFPTTRLSLLFACLDSAKRSFNAFYKLSPSIYFDIPYSTWTLLSHLHVVLSKLSLCVVPGWDHKYVAETLSIYTLLDELSARVREATHLAERPQTSEAVKANNSLPRRVPLIFTAIETKVKEIMAIQDARRSEASRRSQAQTMPAPHTTAELVRSEGIVSPLPDEFTMMDSVSFFDFMDQSFWTESWS